MFSTETTDAARDYAESIRNGAKRSYALAYLHQTIRNGLPEPERGELSFMAAQAVRMQIRQIVQGAR